jgi:toxin ParE1/3/4
MSKAKLAISPAAKSDLTNIYRYGLTTWGAAQSFSYLTKLKTEIWRLVDYPMIGADRSRLLPNLRSLPVGSHILFYRFERNTVQLVRVLHGRQDPEKNLLATTDSQALQT